MSLYRGKSTREVYLASLLYDSIDDNNFSAVKLLLCEKEADPNIILPAKTISSFHLVIGCDDEHFALNVTRLILQHGGNPNVSSDEGLTPVHIAAAWGRIEILDILMSCGGDPEFRDSNWMTPIHYAKKENYLDCLNLLRSYLPIQYDVLHKETEDCYHYKLDTLIVNNGYATGEYKVCLKTDDSINTNKVMEKLASLPKPDTTKYVLNWFDTHIDDRGGQTYIKNASNPGSQGEDDAFLPYESSVDESANEDNRKRSITFRKAYKKKMKYSKRNIPSVLVLSDEEKLQTAKHCAISSAEAENKNVSSESGIATLPNSKESLTSTKPVTDKINPDNFDNRNLELKKFDSKMCPSFTGSNRLEDFKSFDRSRNTKNLEHSSDYTTTSSGNSLLNKNIFVVTCDSNLFTSDESCVDNDKIASCDNDNAVDDALDDAGSSELTFVTVSEVYKYEDKDEGIVLFEKRVIKVASECSGSVRTLSSKMSSLPETFEYDADTLRRELTLLGYEPGPITLTTKRVYLRKLYQLKKQPVCSVQKTETAIKRVYSPELEKTLKDPKWPADLSPYRQLEEVLVKEFSIPAPSRKWREGNAKSSFTYLLLDPRRTDNLPCRADTMNHKEVWETFLSAIFYVGKGKRTRPYSHLYEAVTLWRQCNQDASTKKLKTILDIWKSGSGVICLHVFQNVIPVEAYTREAAMISALTMENISNARKGEFYGLASTWQAKQKKMLGTFLLHKAMMVFLNEGERQLYAADIATA